MKIIVKECIDGNRFEMYTVIGQPLCNLADFLKIAVQCLRTSHMVCGRSGKSTRKGEKQIGKRINR